MKRGYLVQQLLLLTLLCGFARFAFAEDLASSAPVPEYDMKAAYLYNFAVLTTWPGQNQTNIRMCVLGHDNFRGSLEQLTKKTKSGMQFSLRYLADLNAVSSCQLLFIDSSENVDAAILFKQLEGLSVLTVTDNAALFDAGVMLGMFVDSKRLVFDVNHAQAQKAGLALSSKLLRVARKVF
ncbi:MAG: hypothetical protein CVU29_11445 [Betaproteobacteria bacterium HGW-Betaproteobacteria-22]|nr:MAG: hypothetical protein CVU29_11445 [Betaproteobacteria bacterium HGW-Betaproteobacteria-22]